MNRSLLIYIIVILNFFSADIHAQENKEVTIDSTDVIEKTFLEDLSQKYTSKEFDYDVAEGEAQNLLVRAIVWFVEKIGDIFGVDIGPEAYKILEFIVYVLLTIFVGYLILKLLLGTNAGSLFTKKTAAINPLTVEEEHIERIDLDRLIHEALEQNKYRSAIRFMYLRSLRELSLHNFISWHFDKTNSDYYHEIEDPSLKDNFRKVSYLYDYVWYGEFELDETGFKNAKRDFDRLTQQLENAG